MTAPEISEEMRQAVLNANLTKLLPAEVDRILEAVAPLLIREGMERAAEIAEGVPLDARNGRGEIMYRTCPYTYPGNWAVERHWKNEYGNARNDAATAILIAASEM